MSNQPINNMNKYGTGKQQVSQGKHIGNTFEANISVETNVIIAVEGNPLFLNGKPIREGDLDFLEKGESVNGGKVGQVNNYYVEGEIQDLS